MALTIKGFQQLQPISDWDSDSLGITVNLYLTLHVGEPS